MSSIHSNPAPAITPEWATMTHDPAPAPIALTDFIASPLNEFSDLMALSSDNDMDDQEQNDNTNFIYY